MRMAHGLTILGCLSLLGSCSHPAVAAPSDTLAKGAIYVRPNLDKDNHDTLIELMETAPKMVDEYHKALQEFVSATFKKGTWPTVDPKRIDAVFGKYKLTPFALCLEAEASDSLEITDVKLGLQKLIDEATKMDSAQLASGVHYIIKDGEEYCVYGIDVHSKEDTKLSYPHKETGIVTHFQAHLVVARLPKASS